MKRAALVALLLMGPVAAQPSAPPKIAPEADTGYFQVISALDPHVWMMFQDRFQVQPTGNVTLIEQSDGIVLVDAGGSPGDGRRIVNAVRKFSHKPVKAVILSQWHGDKVQGLSEILKAWPRARTIATLATKLHLSDPRTMNSPGAPDAERNARTQRSIADTAAAMRAGAAKATDPALRLGFARAANMFDQYGPDMDGVLTLAPHEAFADVLDIPDRTAPVKAMFLGRADTDGDAVVWLPKQRILIAGETVILPFPYGYKSYPREWIAVLEKLRAYHFKWLVPGHGPLQNDRTQIDKIAAALKDVRAQVAPLVAQGLTLPQVQQKVDMSAHAQAFCGSDPWLRKWFQAFFVEPVVVSAYKEARGEAIVQSLGG